MAVAAASLPLWLHRKPLGRTQEKREGAQAQPWQAPLSQATGLFGLVLQRPCTLCFMQVGLLDDPVQPDTCAGAHTQVAQL